MKRIISISVFLTVAAVALAQSNSYELSKWVVLQSSILKELNKSYVDSLPVGRIEKAGVEAMLEALDPYTVYIPEEDNADFQMMINSTYGGIGAIIYKPEKNGNVIINEPYENSPAARAGLRCGDQIVEIDGKAAAGLTVKESSDRMKGKPGTVVNFKVKKVRTGELVDLKIQRERIHIPDVTYSGMLDKETGYICLDGFTEGVADEIRSEILRMKKECGMKRFVLDLRGNGGGLLSEAVKIVALFVPTGSLVVSSKGRSLQETQELRTTTPPVSTDMPVAIMVDSGSASASEIVAGALQDMDRATIFGTRTFGKGLVQSVRPLPYNGQLKVTTAKYYTPSGRCVQAIDYAHRKEDGSVGHIPDSLTHEFKTLSGRTVRDGGGIVPDIIQKRKEYGRIAYSLVLDGVVEQYVLDYVARHESIPALSDFHFDEYEDFVKFASTKKFDSRTSSKAVFDKLKSEIAKDGMTDDLKEQMDALEKALNIDKETLVRNCKNDMIPFLEEEIAVRYYYQRAGHQVRLRYDDEVKEVLSTKWLF